MRMCRLNILYYILAAQVEVQYKFFLFCCARIGIDKAHG